MKSPPSPVSSIQAVAVTQHEITLPVRKITARAVPGRAIVSGDFQPSAYKELTLSPVSSRVSKNGPERPFLTA